MNGAIAASHPQTVAAGKEILQAGGNAVDAAVAATFASFVAEPVLTSIGGSGVAVVYDPQRSTAAYYDFFSAMPSGKMTPEADFQKITVDFGATTQDFYIGRASVAVPGAVAGLCLLAERQGTLPLDALLAPAVRLAHEGSRFTPFMAETLRLLAPIFTHTPEIAAYFAPRGRLLAAGDTFRLPPLAALLEEIAAQGSDAFYRGRAAEAFLADQQAHGGLVQPHDLADYAARPAEPLRVRYRDVEVLLPGYPSSGGVLVAFALRLLERTPLRQADFLSPEHLAALVEVMRLSNLARADLQWDEATAAQAAQAFLADEHVAAYADRLGAPPPRPARGVGNTTHISVTDAHGMTVSLTTTAGEAAGYLIPETGVIPNNMLGEINLHPNGFHRLPAGRRLPTMMTPAIVLRDGRPVFAVGSGGSTRIRSAVLQVLSHIIDFGVTPQQAVEAPRVHYEDGVVQVEGGMPEAAIAGLRQRGYRLNVWQARSMYFGGANAVAWQAGRAEAAGDPRRGGVTAVV